MPLIPIMSRWTASVLFEHDVDPNSLTLTLEAGVTTRADLRGADLRGEDLRNAHLQGANLQGAHLQGAHLQDADLRAADLRAANLQGADLRAANLQGAHLQGAHLQGADLRDAKEVELVQAQTSIVPATGSFEGWKLCANKILVHVRIPADAQRSNATGRKCRAAYVETLEVLGAEEAISLHDSTTVYRAGVQTHCDSWDPDRWEECSGGIHFYLTRVEAEHHA